MHTGKYSGEQGGTGMLNYARQRDRLTVALTGELDHYSAIGVRRELDALLSDEAVRHLLLDMTELKFMDSSGIGVILGRYRILNARGGSVWVRNMNPQISRIFHLSGMGQVIHVAEPTKEARR